MKIAGMAILFGVRYQYRVKPLQDVLQQFHSALMITDLKKLLC